METKQDEVDAHLLISSSEEFLQNQKRVLSQIKDEINVLPKKVKTECQGDGDNLPSDVRIECQQVVDEFKKKKIAFVQLLSRIKLLDNLENVPKDEWPSPASCDEEAKEVRSQLKGAKRSAADLEEKVKEMITATEDKTLQAKLETFESRLEQVQEEMATLQQVVETRSQSLSELEGSDLNVQNFQQRFENETAELRLAEETLSNYQPLLSRLREGVADIRSQCQETQAETELARQALSNLKASQLENQQQEQDKRKWCDSAYQNLVELTGVSERSLGNDSWTLELNTAGCSLSDREGMKAVLTLHFKPGTAEWEPKTLSSATIDIETLDISDLVAEGVRKNNIAFLVSAVMKKLKNHAPLFMEVEQLRHQYAIDWQSEEGILRVILGDSGHIVCTLSVATGPLGLTLTQLKSVEGASKHPPIEELKPPQESPRISEWLEYLKEAVHNF
ncbi:uncharacterized protein LOC117299792 [Asterias rubens]|uniref:uncharacterized protein LOC117299792 n=1 Tax=Asterias rubens TaxID=7604 RepID=UPI0014555BF1|nr:uncharacterized protein LOC117299792 [Asterias rubens]